MASVSDELGSGPVKDASALAIEMAQSLDRFDRIRLELRILLFGDDGIGRVK